MLLVRACISFIPVCCTSADVYRPSPPALISRNDLYRFQIPSHIPSPIPIRRISDGPGTEIQGANSPPSRSDASIGCCIMTSSAITKPKMTVKKSIVNAVM